MMSAFTCHECSSTSRISDSQVLSSYVYHFFSSLLTCNICEYMYMNLYIQSAVATTILCTLTKPRCLLSSAHFTVFISFFVTFFCLDNIHKLRCWCILLQAKMSQYLWRKMRIDCAFGQLFDVDGGCCDAA